MTGPLMALAALDIPVDPRPPAYPAAFAAAVAGRERRRLGDAFGLRNFGVNLLRLPPGISGALKHRHSRQDEFVYVLTGAPTLITDHSAQRLSPGCCVGFQAGGEAHRIVNLSDHEALLLEIGDRTEGDDVDYPDDDLVARMTATGARIFLHRDGTPY